MRAVGVVTGAAFAAGLWCALACSSTSIESGPGAVNADAGSGASGGDQPDVSPGNSEASAAECTRDDQCPNPIAFCRSCGTSTLECTAPRCAEGRCTVVFPPCWNLGRACSADGDCTLDRCVARCPDGSPACLPSRCEQGRCTQDIQTCGLSTCPAGFVPGVQCVQCGPVGGCSMFELRCQQRCASQADCEQGQCSQGRCNDSPYCV